MDRTHSLALASLFAGACAIATSAVLVKLTDVGPVASAFWRVALALPVLGLWARLSDAKSRESAEGNPRLLVLAGIFFAGDLGFWHWSIVLTSVANATLLANCAPLFVALAVWVIFGRRPRAQFVVGLGTALAGMALLLRGDVRLSGTALLGD